MKTKRFMIYDLRFTIGQWSLALAAGGLLALAGCAPKPSTTPLAGDNLRYHLDDKPAADVRRLVFAQIVEDIEPDKFAESAILEGKAYKYFLQCVARTNHDRLRKHTDEKITFEGLLAQPGLYRGQVVTLNRGVIVEAAEAKLPSEYRLPDYTVLVGVFVDSARDVYGVRILCPPKSRLYEKLQKGIVDDAYPVCRMTGYFMKLYARRTGDPNEPPWRRPLLICPEPEFSQLVEPRHVKQDMEDAKVDKLLPSERIQAVGAEERLVVEMQPGGRGLNAASIQVEERVAGRDLNAFIADEVAALRQRLPEEQAANPAAVILISKKAPREHLRDVVAALRAAGVKRLAIKREE